MLKKVVSAAMLMSMVAGTALASPSVGIMTISDSIEAQEENVADEELFAEDFEPEEEIEEEEVDAFVEEITEKDSDSETLQDVKAPKEDSKMVQQAKEAKARGEKTTTPEVKPKEEKTVSVKPVTDNEVSATSNQEQKKDVSPTLSSSFPTVSVSNNVSSIYAKAKLLVACGEESVLLDMADLFLCPDEASFSNFSFFVSDMKEDKDGVSFSVLSTDGFEAVSLKNKTTKTIHWFDEDVHFTILPDGVMPKEEVKTAPEEAVKDEQLVEVPADNEEFEDAVIEDVSEVNEPLEEVSEDGEVLYVP